MSQTAAAVREPREAFALCARDAGVEVDRVRVMRVESHYKSRQLYLGIGDDGTSHVIKLSLMAWDPKREYEGYRYLESALAADGRDAGGDVPRLGAIRAVGFGTEPAFLVTAFQAGRSARPEFDAGTAWRAAPARVRSAAERARGIAAWSSRTRHWNPRRQGGPGADALLGALERHVEEILRHLGGRAGRDAGRALPLAERLVAGLNRDDSERLHWRFAHHGDLAPQNFRLGPDGVLYALDLENFGFEALHRDLSMFRSRLETYALRGSLPRRHAGAIWRAFLDETRKRERETSDAWRVLAHLQRLLAHLAWLRNPEYLARQRPDRPLANRLRQHLWLRSRLAWLRDLPEDPVAATRRFVDVL